MNDRPYIVAVDGPAGSGKSSICQKVASTLQWNYVNTGAIYRALGIIALREAVDLKNADSLLRFLQEFSEQLSWNMQTSEIFFANDNLSSILHTEEASKGASLVATIPIVREKLLPLQRRLILATENGSIVDGRDIGTVVFPDAELKIFMTASLEERAKRRLFQLHGQNEQAIEEHSGDYMRIKSEIAKRDDQDRSRGSAPLVQAKDAVVFDTSELDFKGAVDSMIQLIRSKLNID